MATFDIVIPTLDVKQASSTVAELQRTSDYAHRYIIMDNTHAPEGYTAPCNFGAKAGDSSVVCFVNDDITVNDYGWDEPFIEEAQKGTYCFGPWTPTEANMKLNGWFLCLRRDYMDAYGYAFDPQFRVWCGDIDLLKRLELDGIEPVLVKDTGIEHQYSKTCSRPDVQSWIIPAQLMDIDRYKAKWGSDPNEDKVR